jgi:predicted RNA-binding Zn-ribbon protein involved in translation (DUF1610 family)
MKNAVDIADVFRAGFSSYCKEFGPIPKEHYDVANAITSCHTAIMGGHVYHCESCKNELISYNSCRNRHCPSCQAAARATWVEKRTGELLPVPYFHVVFTVPSQLNPFALRNKVILHSILFKAASETLLELGRDNRHLGAKTGFISILHTWGQNLLDHPHLHCIVPGGGLNDDSWVQSKSDNFLFPVAVIAALFRGKFMDYFKEAIKSGEIVFHGSLKLFEQDLNRLQNLISYLYTIDWVVYVKPPFGGPEAVIKYLGRYTHRIAIANSRILSLTDTHVTFRWKDYADGDKQKEMTLTISEFIRRFLLHVVPKGFVRIRYYGFLSTRTRKNNLQLCRDQLLTTEQLLELEKTELEEMENGIVIKEVQYKCPHCGHAKMHKHKEITRTGYVNLIKSAA